MINPNLIIDHSKPMPDQLTVEAWVHSGDARAEVLQVVASQWRPREAFDLFDGFDASHIDGLNTSGYYGAVFDGRHVYFCPELHPDGGHGVVLRYDTHRDFHDRDSYEAYDANPSDGRETRGYYGGVYDGRYVYFVPRHYDGYPHSRLLRFDPFKEFRDPSAWSAFDFGERQTHQGAAFDGRHIYFCPGYRNDEAGNPKSAGRMIRYDTWSDFYDPRSYERFDAEHVEGRDVGCYDGGAFDGRHIYFVPLSNSVTLRYDTQQPFHEDQSWQATDAGTFGLGMCVGAVFDGRFLYYVPYDNGRMVRFDTERDFYDPAGWSMHEASQTGGLDTRGYDGGFFDGIYVYFVPFVIDSVFHARWLRYDTQQPFESPDAWTSRDVPFASDVKTIGYNGGAFDGRFFYGAPWRSLPGETMAEWDIHGRITRYDTLGVDGTFSLRYCDYGHNGGLCAATPGPSFLVNTTSGVRSASSHAPLSPGMHHLAGVYDGLSIKLYIDGNLVVEKPGQGKLLDCDVPMTVGHMGDDLCLFLGEVHQVRITYIAISSNRIRESYQKKIE